MTVDGKTPLKQDGKIVMLAEVAQNALLASYQDEPNLSGEEKVKRFAIARKIEEQPKDPSLSAEDIALIKKLIAKAYNPLVTSDAWLLLDPASVPK